MATELWTAVAVKMSGKQIIGFTVVNNNYIITEWTADEMRKRVQENSITNIGMNNGEFFSINGDIKRYTHYSAENGGLIGNPTAVILNRIERDNKLIGYTVFMPNGCIKKLSVSNAVELHKQMGIANGKIRHTTYGDILSSIKNEYPVMAVDIEKADTGTVDVQMVYFADAIADNKMVLRYAALYVSGTSVSKISKVMNVLEETSDEAYKKLSKYDMELAKSTRIIRGGVSKFFVTAPYNVLGYVSEVAGIDVDIAGGKTIVTRTIFSGEGSRAITLKGGKIAKDGVFTEKEEESFMHMVKSLKARFK